MLETTIAGSLPKPAWLAEPEKLWPAWRLEGAELERGKRDAVLIWLKEQEDAGVDIVSNGEQFRTHFVHGFLEHIDGIDWQLMTKMGIRDDRYVVDVPTVTRPVRRKGSVHGEEVEFTRRHTRHPMYSPALNVEQVAQIRPSQAFTSEFYRREGINAGKESTDLEHRPAEAWILDLPGPGPSRTQI